MKTIKWTLFFYISLIFILISNNFAFSENLNIPSKIQFKLNNSEYNKYIRRAMRAYTDGELYGQSNIKKKYKKWVKAKIIVEKKKNRFRNTNSWRFERSFKNSSNKLKS